MIYSFDKENGSLTPAAVPFAQLQPGSGPRHFVFHPNNKWAYLVEELTGEVVTYDYNKKTGGLTQLQTISSFPAGFNGYPGSADIHISPDGKFLYASNRGDANNIAIFKISDGTGMLTSVGFQSVLGKTPRNFIIAPSGNFLFVANQDSDEIVVFNRDMTSGMLTDSGQRLSVKKPVSLQWKKK